MPARILATDSGTYFHRSALTDPRVAQYLAGTAYLPELESNDLAGMDVLVIACRTPPGRIARKIDIIERFLASGGTLAIMGETDPHLWWPHHRFTPMAINFTWWLEPGAHSGLVFPRPNHALFDHIKPEHCQWHYHGAFERPDRAEEIIGCKEGLSVLLDDRASCAPGRVLATGLDPFYHHGAGFMPNATRFLLAYLAWLKGHASREQSC